MVKKYLEHFYIIVKVGAGTEEAQEENPNLPEDLGSIQTVQEEQQTPEPPAEDTNPEIKTDPKPDNPDLKLDNPDPKQDDPDPKQDDPDPIPDNPEPIPDNPTPEDTTPTDDDANAQTVENNESENG